MIPLVGATIGLGIGAEVLGGFGSIGGKGVKGLSNVARYLPSVGNIYGAGLVFKSLRGLKQKKNKKFVRVYGVRIPI